MIKHDLNHKTIRETTAEYTIEADGKKTTETIRVLYYAMTTKFLRERNAYEEARRADAAKKRAAGETVSDFNLGWATDVLKERLHSLPDITDADGKPYEITIDFLDSLTIENVMAIQEAINADLAPKPQPGT